MQDVKEKAALSSITASAGLTLAKAVVGALSGSLAILSEAAHSLLDLAATVMTYFAVRISGKPADEVHQYGHGKVESVAALIETGLLFLLSAAVIWKAGQRLWSGNSHPVEATWWAFVVVAASIVVDFFRARVLYRVARESGSEAREADALHFGSDMWSSLAVLVGLGGVALGLPAADALAALVVAVFVCLAGWRLGRRTLDTLTDAAPSGAAEKITRAALRIRGVVAVARVRVRQVGANLFVDLAVVVSRTLPLDRVTELKNEVVAAIRRELPTAEVVLTTEPRALSDETVLELVMVIARNLALAVHHVTVHSVEGRLAVAIDLEVAGKLTLREAHAIASRLEQAVRDELGPEVEVETHIEPLQTDHMSGREADSRRTGDVEQALGEIAAQLGPIREIHDVRMRDTDDGEIVNFHCYADPRMTVQEVREKVDEIERALRQRIPSIKRVIGHAEPRG